MKDKVRYQFGEKLRTVRERKQITLKSVAQKAGVSESLVSQIERNRVSPSLDTLMSIAEVLQIDLEFLFSDFKKTQPVQLVRKAERNVMNRNSVQYQQLSQLSDPKEPHAIEAFLITIDVGQEKGDSDYGHPGKELGLIIDGKGELHYGTEVYQLDKGDSVSFPSDIPHTLKNTGDIPLKAVWVITPPRLFT